MIDVLASNPPSRLFRKRKAENYENNERLSKRLSLLNLELPGQKIFVPAQPPINHSQSPSSRVITSLASDNDLMQVEDTKHKVFIHDLEAEILEAQSDEAKLIFHPDIEKHLRDCRIPPPFVAPVNNTHNNKQLVLYNEPGSITIPEELDSVRRIIMETRSRIRERQGLQNREMPIEQHEEQTMEKTKNITPFSCQPANINYCIDSHQTQELDPDTMDLDIA